MRLRKRRMQDGVDLNLAAMLDMAFQMLAFFILTYKPAPNEGQIAIRLPPATAQRMPDGHPPGQTDPQRHIVGDLNTIFISVVGDARGAIQTIAVADRVLSRPRDLAGELQAIFGQPGSPFEQVVLQVSPDVQYQGLIEVIDVCSKTTLPDGQPLRKVSLVELSANDKM